MSSPAPTRPRSAVREFLESEAAGGIILMLAAALALVIANSALGEAYRAWLDLETGPVMTEKLGPMTPLLWINDGLMAIFFLYVGLEIKREFIDGRLSTWPQRRLPAVAALAGMAMPALVYLAVTSGNPELTRGWAIPAATDIAFAIGVLALLGKRAPTSLKLFLVTVAIIDDMGAVTIIALFYTASLKLPALSAAAAIFIAMLALNRMGVRSLIVYSIGFALLWYATLLSGVHATIAGVLAAFAVPIIRTPGAPDSAESPLHRLEHALHAPVAFFIVPLFGFANAGVAITGLTAEQIFSPLTLGIAAGLFIGKQLGIFGAIWLSVISGFAAKPRGSTWLQLYAVATLCGIGFTMSLFIGGLAFYNPVLVEEAKIGILGGSILSALIGYVILRVAPLHPGHVAELAQQEDELERDGDIDGFDDPDERQPTAKNRES
jgi:Na+:H+ antiporter, NhaA family